MLRKAGRPSELADDHLEALGPEHDQISRTKEFLFTVTLNSTVH